jgi:glucose-1-phosphate thymidylyltransferase
MINVVLAAGYATRLGELTKNFPKPLLKIGNSTILGRMLDDIDNIDDITEHVIVTNHRFTPIFEEWVKTPSGSPCLGGRLVGVGGRYKKPITIIDDGSTTNDNRLGAVCDLLMVMEKTPSSSPCLGGERPPQSPCLGGDKKSSLRSEDLGGSEESSLNREDIGGSDLLVVAADNLLFFSFQEFVDFARAKGTSCIMCHEQPSIEKLQRTGVVELDENNRVVGMEEKPQVPKSHWAVPPFYIYLKKDLDLVRHSVENGCGKDAPGNLAHYMVEHTTMHAWPMSAGRFDIGSLDTYYEAVEKFGDPSNSPA